MVPSRRMILAAVLCLFGLVSTLESASTARAVSDEKAAICAQAEERFQELYGDMPIEPGTIVIKMYKYTFCPLELEVPVGTKVRWINVDKRTSHSVWFKEVGDEESERLFPDEFVEMTLETPGRFDYICGPHGEQEGMRASLTVTP